MTLDINMQLLWGTTTSGEKVISVSARGPTPKVNMNMFAMCNDIVTCHSDRSCACNMKIIHENALYGVSLHLICQSQAMQAIRKLSEIM